MVLSISLKSHLRARGERTRSALSLLDSRRAALGIVLLIVALFAVVAWHDAVVTMPQNGYDAEAHIAYAEILDHEGRLPTKAESYEYATPPLYAWLAVRLQHVVDSTGGFAKRSVGALSGVAAQLGWLALVAVAIGLVSRPGRWRLAGGTLALLAVALALLRADVSAAGTRWAAGQFLSVVWTVGALMLAYALAREVWPRRPLLAVVATAATVCIPIVLRLATMFHPEAQFAFFSLAALLLVIRAERRAWPAIDGLAAGVSLGLAALTRPTAAVVAVALAFATATGGRRQAVRFAGAAAVAFLLVAGPWWYHQHHRYGNPLQSNLNRPGYMLPNGQPDRFYFSAPIHDLIFHPYRPAFAGELWPQFHADLWSDWFGGEHLYWGNPPDRTTRVFLTSQSILGAVASLLAISGLGVFGVRAFRGRHSFAFAAFAWLAVLSWITFVVTLVRFPQIDGDPIKASYMLYLAPVFAIAGVEAAASLWRRGRRWRLALVLFAGLFTASAIGFVVTAFPTPPPI